MNDHTTATDDLTAEQRNRGAAFLLGCEPAYLAAAIERARVVAVLDGWAERHPGASVPSPRKISPRWAERAGGEWLIDWAGVEVFGATPDEARAKAAAAIEAGEV